jgi:hypothetical protein
VTSHTKVAIAEEKPTNRELAAPESNSASNLCEHLEHEH